MLAVAAMPGLGISRNIKRAPVMIDSSQSQTTTIAYRYRRGPSTVAETGAACHATLSSDSSSMLYTCQPLNNTPAVCHVALWSIIIVNAPLTVTLLEVNPLRSQYPHPKFS